MESSMGFKMADFICKDLSGTYLQTSKTSPNWDFEKSYWRIEDNAQIIEGPEWLKTGVCFRNCEEGVQEPSIDKQWKGEWWMHVETHEHPAQEKLRPFPPENFSSIVHDMLQKQDEYSQVKLISSAESATTEYFAWKKAENKVRYFLGMLGSECIEAEDFDQFLEDNITKE